MATPASTPVQSPAVPPAAPEARSGKTLRPSWRDKPQHTLLRKALFQLHLWSGLILGVYIVVVCASGSALVFRNDIFNLIERRIREGTSSSNDFDIRATYAALRWFSDLHGR